MRHRGLRRGKKSTRRRAVSAGAGRCAARGIRRRLPVLRNAGLPRRAALAARADCRAGCACRLVRHAGLRRQSGGISARAAPGLGRPPLGVSRAHPHAVPRPLPHRHRHTAGRSCGRRAGRAASVALLPGAFLPLLLFSGCGRVCARSPVRHGGNVPGKAEAPAQTRRAAGVWGDPAGISVHIFIICKKPPLAALCAVRGGGIFEENDGGDRSQLSACSEFCGVRIPSGPSGQLPLYPREA